MNIGSDIEATGSGRTNGNNRRERRWGDVSKHVTNLYENKSLQKHQCKQIHTNLFLKFKTIIQISLWIGRGRVKHMKSMFWSLHNNDIKQYFNLLHVVEHKTKIMSSEF